jgi:hypothetical protein
MREFDLNEDNLEISGGSYDPEQEALWDAQNGEINAENSRYPVELEYEHVETLIKANPMHYRERVYIRMLSGFVGVKDLFWWSKGPQEQEDLAKRKGFAPGFLKTIKGQLHLAEGFWGTDPGVYVEHCYSGVGLCPTPNMEGVDKVEWFPLEKLPDLIHEMANFGPLLSTSSQVNDGMERWAHAQQAWAKDENKDDFDRCDPYNWCRYWIVDRGAPPIMIDPDYILFFQGKMDLRTPKRAPSPFAVKQEGSRWYVVAGPTYEGKEWLKTIGCRWDPTKKKWWTMLESVVNEILWGPEEMATPGSVEFYVQNIAPTRMVSQLLYDRSMILRTQPLVP